MLGLVPVTFQCTCRHVCACAVPTNSRPVAFQRPRRWPPPPGTAPLRRRRDRGRVKNKRKRPLAVEVLSCQMHSACTISHAPNVGDVRQSAMYAWSDAYFDHTCDRVYWTVYQPVVASHVYERSSLDIVLRQLVPASFRTACPSWIDCTVAWTDAATLAE